MPIRPATAGTLLTATVTAGLAAAVLAVPAARAATPTSTTEKGLVIECTTRIGGAPAYVSLYENNRFADVAQVAIGEAGGSREVDRIAVGRNVRTAVRVAGARARVTGTLRVTGAPTPVHEEHDDAGQHIVVDGTHRAITARLRLSYRGDTARLDCDNAFRYRLRVTRTPVV